MNDIEFKPLDEAEATVLRKDIAAFRDEQSRTNVSVLAKCAWLRQRFEETGNPTYVAVAWHLFSATSYNMDEIFFDDAINAISEPCEIDAMPYVELAMPSCENDN